jgi:hypothetical protein
MYACVLFRCGIAVMALRIDMAFTSWFEVASGGTVPSSGRAVLLVSVLGAGTKSLQVVLKASASASASGIGQRDCVSVSVSVCWQIRMVGVSEWHTRVWVWVGCVVGWSLTYPSSSRYCAITRTTSFLMRGSSRRGSAIAQIRLTRGQPTRATCARGCLRQTLVAAVLVSAVRSLTHTH